MRDAVCFVFGYGSLASPDDPMVGDAATQRRSRYGMLHGYRRSWLAGIDNRSSESDHKHFVDDASGERFDGCVLSLTAIRADTGDTCNGVAIRCDPPLLALLDQREFFFRRIDVSASFRPRLDLPVFTYVAQDDAVTLARRFVAAGRAAVSREYVDLVEHAFSARGPEALAAYRASTPEPPCATRDLRLVRQPGRAGL